MAQHSADQQDATVRVACPACRTIYAIKSALLGKRLKCARCRADWKAISPGTLRSAGDKVSVVDAQLMGVRSPAGTPAVQQVPADLPYDYWLGKKIGRYAINSILGTGAVGYVYRGHDHELGRDVALKILAKPQGKHMTLRVKLFLQEARAAARLQHPNVVTIHEVGLDGQFYFFAMEVVDGGTLKDLTLALGRLSPARSCYLIAQAAQALAHAHDHGVIHRDVKPDNLMMDSSGLLKLADFGLAEIGEVDLMKLYQGRPIGTPGYIAPETARGEGATSASDTYCLGLCLYHALTGFKYLTAPNVKDLVTLCAYPPEFEPGPKLIGIPAPCLRILKRCLQAEPQDRYPNAADLADELRQFVVDAGHDDSHARLPLPGAAPMIGRLDAQGRWSVGRYLKRRKTSKY